MRTYVEMVVRLIKAGMREDRAIDQVAHAYNVDVEALYTAYQKYED